MTHTPPTAAIIGAGPAGLAAAETLAEAGFAVTIFDRMPSPARKFLMAGRGGLNLTHSETLDAFLDRYGAARAALEPAIRAFPPAALIAWAETLGQKTFVGSSGRVFPKSLKASPLLRAWLADLANLGVSLRRGSEWAGWTEAGDLHFADGLEVAADVTILALGGASWPRLGSIGTWTRFLPPDAIRPWQPANCGFAIAWSDIFRTRYAGTPLKRIAITFNGRTQRGEAMITETGIEGGAIYALSAMLRDAIAAHGPTSLHLDLRPDIDRDTLTKSLAVPRRGQSLSSFLRKHANLPPVAVGLVQEALHLGSTADLIDLVKSLPLTLTAPSPIARAISSAGGVAFSALDDHFMLRARPGVFVAGEMLDWESPTGGYLLQACFSTARFAAAGAIDFIAKS
jgi:uncharacterized flavoprotein (TIGR03862 family)